MCIQGKHLVLPFGQLEVQYGISYSLVEWLHPLSSAGLLCVGNKQNGNKVLESFFLLKSEADHLEGSSL